MQKSARKVVVFQELRQTRGKFAQSTHQRPQQFVEPSQRNARDIFKGLLPAILALIGVTLGSVLTYQFSAKTADREYERRLQDNQLERKLRLYERTARLQEKLPEISSLFELEFCKPKPSCTLKQGLTPVEATKRLSDFKAERRSLQMETLLVYGDRVAKIVIDSADEKGDHTIFFVGLRDELNDVLGAMYVELAKEHGKAFSWTERLSQSQQPSAIHQRAKK